MHQATPLSYVPFGDRIYNAYLLFFRRLGVSINMVTQDPEVLARKAQQNSTDIVSGDVSFQCILSIHLLNTLTKKTPIIHHLILSLLTHLTPTTNLC